MTKFIDLEIDIPKPEEVNATAMALIGGIAMGETAEKQNSKKLN
ncbi:MAG: hypothetical protein R3Y32_07690 [Bacillota bacterium]